MKRITFISDTHGAHKKIEPFLTGGDILIHAGDLTGRGSKQEILDFLKWFNDVEGYEQKIFIAGNHDFGFQDNPKWIREILKDFENIDYLEDNLYVSIEEDYESAIKLYGSPWQPRFFDWAFNLDRGEQLKEKWEMIPVDTDILITHGPPYGKLDWVERDMKNVGCVDLMDRVNVIKPKIHVFGHIHEGAGYVYEDGTHYINAAVLNGRYEFRNRPIHVEWNPDTNELNIINYE